MVGRAKGNNLRSETGCLNQPAPQICVRQLLVTSDLQMSRRQPSLPSKLRIWQQNVHKANAAQEYIRNTARPKDWDVIALQEPWLNTFNNSRENPYWRVIYPVNHLLDGQDHTRSILLVNANISSDCYVILPIMHSDITAVQFKGEHRNLTLFNIYNEITNNNMISFLDEFLSLEAGVPLAPEDHMFWLGDFNRHHPMWEDESNKHLFESKDFMQPLLKLLYMFDMTMALPKGLPTYQTVANNWTRPDNVWCINHQDDLINRCNVMAAICPPQTDHLPIVTILDFPLPRSEKQPGCNFHEADWPVICEKLDEQLKTRLPATRIRTVEEFDERVLSFTKVLTEVLDSKIPTTKPNPFARRWCGIKYFSRDRICQVFKTLSPYKDPGPDGIPNVVDIKCLDVLIDHIFFIYRTVLELRQYHGSWCESVTVVLRKLGKTDYGVAKVYRPIGLLNTIGKGFDTLASCYVSFLCEKHNLLPVFQFGGRPGCNTLDVMLLITAQRFSCGGIIS